ncbi:MAG: CoB--CoM heterodisulfide reductase iron-sulfur subunit A family protein [bacterium]|nr:CoB--CoM heterodisulfide reductase iron-sulfur subunit A family protein [bacterium]
MSRIGVFVCHCGENISRTVSAEEVAEFASQVPGTVFAADYPYLCSAPGQKILTEAIKENDLTGVVVAACSPQLHEPTFRTAAAQAGLNPYLCEIANIREQCSWVHREKGAATAKACQIVAGTVERVKLARPLEPLEVPVTDRALVIGGGIAGIRSALDIANSGHEVVLVEREPSLGGNMARLSETFPTLDCSQCILTPLMVEVARHPNIEVLTYSEVEEVSGYVGNFTAQIRRKPRFVRADDCTGCGDCAEACPETTPNEFDVGLRTRKAIYIPFPQAVPSVYTLDADRCLNANLESPTGFRVLGCVRCEEVCEPKVIDFDMTAETVERQVGAIIVATGYDLMLEEQATELGYRQHPDVLDGLEFERLLSASGPTDGMVRRPSDGKVPKDVVFIQCVGSRNPEHGVSYCSRICCMYTAKHALLLKHKVPDSRAYVFFMDVRAAGKGYEEFVQRAISEEHVMYIRGRVSQVFEENGSLRVLGVDTLSGRTVQIDADMVVLAAAAKPAVDNDLAAKLRLPVDSHGFFQEVHPKLRPVETVTPGIFIAGTAQAPRDIPDTVAQASAAASKGTELLSSSVLLRDPTSATVNEGACAGCLECQLVCPYQAIEAVDILNTEGEPMRVVARVNSAVCEGCGICTVTCRGSNIDLAGCSEEEIFAQLGALGRLPSKLQAEGME